MPETTVDLHPLLDNPDALGIVNDMLAAQSESEWNLCLARLVTFLFVASTPRREGEVDPAREAHLTYKLLQLRALIERGRQITRNRHPHRLQARTDARNLELRAARTMEQALTVFEVQEPLPPGATDDERRKQKDNFRDRLERAEAVGGFRVPRRAKRKAYSKG
jgi:hypothetical protein